MNEQRILPHVADAFENVRLAAIAQERRRIDDLEADLERMVERRRQKIGEARATIARLEVTPPPQSLDDMLDCIPNPWNRKLIGATMDNLAQGYSESAALVRAQQAQNRTLDDGAAQERVQQALQTPVVNAAITAVLAAQGLSKEKLAKLLIDHAEGNFTKQVLDADGEIIELKIAPNYKAAIDLAKYIFGPPVTKALVGHVNLNNTGRGAGGDEPEMNMRPVGAANLSAMTLEGNGTVQDDDDEGDDDADESP